MSEIRFATSADGTRIAYTTFGSGPPLVEVPRWAHTIEWSGVDEQFAGFYKKLGAFCQVTIVERRGTGASQREVKDLSIEAHVADLRAVVDKLGLEQFDLLGGGDGAAVCIRAANEFAHRVRKLVLWGAFAKLDVDDEMRETNLQFARTNWPGLGRLISDAFFPNIPAGDARKISALWAASVGQDVAIRYLESVFSFDVTSELHRVEAPTLVMHRRNDGTVHTIERGRKVAAGIRDARFVLVEGEVGMQHYEHDQVIAEIQDFLVDKGSQPEARLGFIPFRAVLFTDLVGHTEMMSRLGDERGREVLREHERITREVLKAHGGTEVKTMGDGFMASFGSVTKAVECAIALQRAFAEHTDIADEPLHVRVGLNAGEPIEEDGDLFGATVILASRIAAKAEGGEILVADTVRGLCSGKGFLFSDRGEFVAKGFEEPVRVYEVRWRE